METFSYFGPYISEWRYHLISVCRVNEFWGSRPGGTEGPTGLSNVMEPIYISKLQEYATPGENAQGAFSVGLAVASRLNGNSELVGTYNPNRVEENPRKIGFITFRDKFASEEEAKAFVEKVKPRYRVATALNEDWAWGEINETATMAMETQGAVICDVVYVGKAGKDVTKAAATPAATPAAQQ